MHYTIDRVLNTHGVQYRIVLWFGRETFTSDKCFSQFIEAQRAAEATGATPKDNSTEHLKERKYG